MNKTVDINERTLEKEKKNFISFCKGAEIFLSIMCAFAIIAPIIVVAITIMSFVTTKAVLTDPETVFIGIYIIVTCIGLAIALNFGIKVFRMLKDGETPFRYEISDKIKAAGMTFFGTGIVHIIGVAVNTFFKATAVFKGEISVNIVLDFFIWGAVLIAIAYIFNYGCKLQQESDETI